MKHTYVVVILPPVDRERLERLLEELKSRFSTRYQEMAAAQPEGHGQE